ncbi:hypothetical protein PACTADRAFT_50447 [Pachysolen tannophilus NRRL Y-2460]|uniref:Uncharacterized protein n=1 Tax=Pachysolen tannophilus NRRL Y-2460 TaxID=669874 RepID=A0A1E4TS56_PACTA|nr:hypothetical protein PACTADRAFT_50447 [Pachysolen tannophilus NRRL Y-2460]
MKNDLNPVEAERRKAKQKDIRKNKRKNLAGKNKKDGEEDIRSRENRREQEEKNNEKDKDIKLGSKSIFYDPEWNPYGTVPEKYANKYPNLRYFPSKKQKSEIVKLDIALPLDDPPIFYKLDSSIINNKVSMSNAHELEQEELAKEKLQKSLVPISVLNKKRKIK